MAVPATDSFLDLVRKSGVIDDQRLSAFIDRLQAAGELPDDPSKLATLMVRDSLLTQFQAEQLLVGKWRGFHIGKYRILERLGSGGMATVYLAEHKFMKRRAAVKVLPKSRAAEPSSLERFYREAKAVAALDHPNIVRAYDIDQDGDVHFLVMEYVDGSSLQDIVRVSGPLDYRRAAGYIRQAADGLAHAHAVGLVHRDIKPGNLLVDRKGVVRVTDMGLARFFNDLEDLITQKYDENVLGTADYLAPEQAIDSHGVDIRADIYSLGCTFYFLLTGKPPFAEGSIAQKLIWQQTRQPKAITDFRNDVPADLIEVISKMTAKKAADRYQTPQEVVRALEPWSDTALTPPSQGEMPQLSPLATRSGFEFVPEVKPAANPGAPGPDTVRRFSPAPSSREPAASVRGTGGSSSSILTKRKPAIAGGSSMTKRPASTVAIAKPVVATVAQPVDASSIETVDRNAIDQDTIQTARPIRPASIPAPAERWRLFPILLWLIPLLVGFASFVIVLTLLRSFASP